MAGGKTSQYDIELLVFGANDRIDVSKLVSTGPDVWETEFVKFSTFKTAVRPTLNEVLMTDPNTDGQNIVVSTADGIEFWNTDTTFKTLISNDQATAGNRIVYLPKFSGQLAYSTADLVSGQITFATTNGALTGDSNLYWDNSNKRLGIGTTSPSYKVHLYSSSDAVQRLLLENTNSGTSAANLLSMWNNNTQGVTMLNFSSNYSGNIQGTSVARNTVQLHVNTFTSADNTGTLVLGADTLYTVGTVFATKVDQNGLGIRGIATIHNANASGNYLTVGGNTFIGGNVSASARLHVVSSSGTALRVDGSSVTKSLVVLDNGNSVFGDDVSSTYKVRIVSNNSDFNGLQINNTSNTSTAGAYLLFTDASTNFEIGLKNGLGYAGYGVAHDFFFRMGLSGGNINFLTDPSSTGAVNFYSKVSLTGNQPHLSILNGRVGVNNNGSSYTFSVTDRGTQTIRLFSVNDNDKIFMSLQNGNAGLLTGELYKDTAANILANGDYVVGMKA